MEKYLFIQDELHVFGHQDVIDAIAKYANEQKLQMYLLKSPLGNKNMSMRTKIVSSCYHHIIKLLLLLAGEFLTMYLRIIMRML